MKIYFFVICLLFIECNSSSQNNHGSNKILNNNVIQKKGQIDSLKIYFHKAKENEIKFIHSFPNSFLQIQETFGYILINDAKTCQETLNYFEHQIKNSKSLNTSGNRDRKKFFNKMYEQIDRLKQNLS